MALHDLEYGLSVLAASVAAGPRWAVACAGQPDHVVFLNKWSPSLQTWRIECFAALGESPALQSVCLMVPGLGLLPRPGNLICVFPSAVPEKLSSVQ